MPIILFTTESDGDLAPDNFGQVELNDTGLGEVTFTIDLNEAIFGPDVDIHQFGFQSNYAGPLVIDPPSIGAADFTVTQNGKVAGLGSLRWDWKVDFDPGTPYLDPITFELSGDPGFTVDSILDASPLNVRGDDSLVAVHAQTTDTASGSETLLGTPNDVRPTGGTVPEASSLLAFLPVMLLGLVWGIRRKRA